MPHNAVFKARQNLREEENGIPVELAEGNHQLEEVPVSVQRRCE